MQQFTTAYSWVYCMSFFGLACIRAIYKEHFDTVGWFFVVIYVTQNLLVNSIDYFLYR